MLTGEDSISYQKVLRKIKQKARRRNRNTKKSNKTVILSKAKGRRIKLKEKGIRNFITTKIRNRRRNKKYSKRSKR